MIITLPNDNSFERLQYLLFLSNIKIKMIDYPIARHAHWPTKLIIKGKQFIQGEDCM